MFFFVAIVLPFVAANAVIAVDDFIDAVASVAFFTGYQPVAFSLPVALVVVVSFAVPFAVSVAVASAVAISIAFYVADAFAFAIAPLLLINIWLSLLSLLLLFFCFSHEFSEKYGVCNSSHLWYHIIVHYVYTSVLHICSTLFHTYCTISK